MRIFCLAILYFLLLIFQKTDFSSRLGVRVRSGLSATTRTRTTTHWRKRLVLDSGDDAGADRTAALADCKTQSGFTSDGRDQLDLHLDVVARHHHLHAFRQLDRARNVRRAEIELRTI